MRVPQVADIEVQCSVRENNNPSSWKFSHENEAFRLEVGSGRATFHFKYTLATLEEAENRVTEFLRSWEGDMLLQTGPVLRQFQVTGCRAPGHGGYIQVYGRGVCAVDEALTRQTMPWRRHRYWGVPIVDALVQRYEDYRLGRERLAVLGYLCLSSLKHAIGSQKALAETLGFEPAVLKEFGRLVSTVGSYRSARKIDHSHDLRDFSPKETYWLETVTRELIARAGEVYSGRKACMILTMRNLPSLECK